MLHTNVMYADSALHSYTSQNVKHRTTRTALKYGALGVVSGLWGCPDGIGYIGLLLVMLTFQCGECSVVFCDHKKM